MCYNYMYEQLQGEQKVEKRWIKGGKKVNMQVNNYILFTEVCKSLSITCESKPQTDTVLHEINAFPCLFSCSTHLQSGSVSEYIFPHQTRKWALWFLPCVEIHWVGFECFFVTGGFIESLIQLFSCWLQQHTMETSCTWWLCSLLFSCSSLGDFW